MFCSKCGIEINDDAVFCSKCGTKVGLASEEQQVIHQQKENRPVQTQVLAMPTGTAALILGLLGMFGGLLPIVRYITLILAIIAIFVGSSQRKRLIAAGLPSGKATAGLVLGIIAVILTVIIITFSAMAIGSLFSGGSSSSTIRINAFTNNLPERIQGTVWTNGYETVEFGKNRVRLNDEWFRVRKITRGNLTTNRMFTWVEFGNRYVTLQNNMSSGPELTRLYRQGARSDNYISGFMTPAQYEIVLKERERIANEILGVWEGSISFRPGGMETLTLNADITLDITYQNRQFQADMNFLITNIRGMYASQAPINTRGSCILDITQRENGEYLFVLSEWSTGTKIFHSVSLNGTVNGNVLSGGSSVSFMGSPFPNRGTFRVSKKN